MLKAPAEDKELAKALILDELFDLCLYRILEKNASGNLKKTLNELIPIETKHCAFWQEFFGIKLETLNFGRRVKLGIISLICKIFGDPAVYLALEAIEVYGIRKYLTIWEQYENTPLANAVRVVLNDEFVHEDQVVSGYTERKINPERIRNIFLGFNDGLVEFVGAVGGFFAAFQSAGPVLIASLTGAAAGALSMAVGVYASSSSEKEIERIASQKEQFLSKTKTSDPIGDSPWSSAVIVGVSYFFGSMVPVLPVFFGTKSVVISWIAGGVMVVLVTTVLSFISGMRIRKRVLMNLSLVTVAVTVAYVVGVLVKKCLGVQIL